MITRDIGAAYDRCRRAGADVSGELSEQDCGSKNLAITDAEGNLFSLGTYAGSAHGDLRDT